MKKLLLLISIFAVLAFAAEIPCEDVLRMADTSGVVIMPKTFDAIQDGSWVCHEEGAGYVAVSTTSHHILRIENGVTVDAFVERLSRGEQEVAVRIDQTRRRSVSFLPYGRIDEWEPIYTPHDTPEELIALIHEHSDRPKDGHGITATEQAAPAPDHIGGAPKGDTKMNRMKELSVEDLRTLVSAKNILVRCGSDENFSSDTERFFTDCATGYARESAIGLIEAVEKCQAGIRVEKLLGEDYKDNMATLKALFYPFAQKLKELRMQLCIDTTGDYKLTAIPDDVEYNGQGGGVDTTALLAATEALDDDLLVIHMGQGKANLRKGEA